MRVGDRAVHTTEPYPAQLAVENERLQRALRARLKEEEALRRVATLVAQEHAPEAVLALVTEEVGRHLEADTAVTVRYDAPGRATFVATWTAPDVPGPSPFRVGRQIELVPQGALARVQETVAPARVDSYEGLPGSFAREVRARGIRAAVAAPILVDGQLWGAFAAGSEDRPVRRRRGGAPRRVRRAGRAGDRQRRRADQAQGVARAHRRGRRRRPPADRARPPRRRPAASRRPRAVAAAGGRGRPSRPPRRRSQGCIEELHTALAELRELARGLHPAVLTERGLPAALQALAARSPVPVVARRRPRRAPACRSRGGAVLRRRRGADQRRQVRQGERRRGDAARRRPLGRDRRRRRRRGRSARRGRQRAARPRRSGRGARRPVDACEHARARHDRSRPRSRRHSERRRVLCARVGHSLARRGGACGLIGLPRGDLAGDDGGILAHPVQER